MASKLSSLSVSLYLWQYLEMYSRTCSLSSKCLFIFVNVTWSAFQMENQAHLSLANCKVLNYIQGLIYRTKPLYQAASWAQGCQYPSINWAWLAPQVSLRGHLTDCCLNSLISKSVWHFWERHPSQSQLRNRQAGNSHRQHILLPVSIWSHLLLS